MVFLYVCSRGGQNARIKRRKAGQKYNSNPLKKQAEIVETDHIHIPSSTSLGWTNEMNLNSEKPHVPRGILPRNSYPYLVGVGEAYKDLYPFRNKQIGDEG